MGNIYGPERLSPIPIVHRLLRRLFASQERRGIRELALRVFPGNTICLHHIVPLRVAHGLLLFRHGRTVNIFGHVLL